MGLAAQDLITVDGDLTLDGTINFVALTDLVPGNYSLFTYTGIFSDLGLHLGTSPTGFNATLFTDLSNFLVGVNVATASPVPEPSTYAALVGALALGATLARRRRR